MISIDASAVGNQLRALLLEMGFAASLVMLATSVVYKDSTGWRSTVYCRTMTHTDGLAEQWQENQTWRYPVDICSGCGTAGEDEVFPRHPAVAGKFFF